MSNTTHSDQVQYQPGDVANGYRLAEDGTTWEPIGQIQVPAEPEKKSKRRWLPWAIGAGVLVLGIGALGAGGSDEEALAEAEAAVAEVEAEAEAAIAEAEAAAAEAEAAAAEAQAEAEAAAAEREADAASVAEADRADEAETDADAGDSFSTQSFLTEARNNLADLRKDVSDAQSALAEGRAVGLGWNFAEIAFNSGQLGALTAPDGIATEWDAAIVELNAGLDVATLGYENDSISEMESGLAQISAAADSIAGLIDRV
jgi:hypothetical protein